MKKLIFGFLGFTLSFSALASQSVFLPNINALQSGTIIGAKKAADVNVVNASASPLPVTFPGKSIVTTVRNDYTGTAVTTGAWVQLVASLSSAVNAIEVIDTSGQVLEIGTGAAASETRLVILPRGGNGLIPVTIASGTRVSIRAVTGTASTGDLIINFYN